MYILINIDLYQKGAESLRIQTKYGLKNIGPKKSMISATEPSGENVRHFLYRENETSCICIANYVIRAKG